MARNPGSTIMPQRPSVVAVIDDDLDMLDAIKRLLTAYEYSTELYASAEAFLQAAPKSEATCLIVDVQLRNACGIQLARQLAKAGFNFPIIFVTASDSESIKRKALEAGCIAFLNKPFSEDELIETLSKSTR